MKADWVYIPGPECKHHKDRVVKNELGYLCKDCMAYIDKNMITPSPKVKKKI